MTTEQRITALETNMATKSDLEDLRAATKSDLEELKAEINNRFDSHEAMLRTILKRMDDHWGPASQ